MITKHSIDLRFAAEPCFALHRNMCTALDAPDAKTCCTVRCPFYKPKDLRGSVRVEDKQGVNLVPFGEYLEARGVDRATYIGQMMKIQG